MLAVVVKAEAEYPVGYAIIDKILDYHTTMVFEFGDTAFEKRCLDDADWAYRHVIRTYTGTAYSGIRDRARLGVEDVRVARNES